MKIEVSTLITLLVFRSFESSLGFTVSHTSSFLQSYDGTLTSFSSSSSLFASESDGDSNSNNANNNNEMEPSSARKTRMAYENELSKRFATGEELKNLRLDLESLKHNLQWAEALKDEIRMESLQKAIQRGEKRDPDLMYKKAIKMIAQAKMMKDISMEERDTLTTKYAKLAAAARKCLPQFNLEGLWVGK